MWHGRQGEVVGGGVEGWGRLGPFAGVWQGKMRETNGGAQTL